MKVLVAYASSEGQTRRIARHVADRLADQGHAVELLQAEDGTETDLARFDRVIVAASIHIGHYQKSLGRFIAEQAGALAGKPSLFLSVSLAAAGHEAEDWRSLAQILADFEKATGWTPGHAEQIAGAYRPSQYDVVTRFVMRRILARKDPEADLEADKDYTDWPALDTLVDSWLTGPA
ncbi:flavodoxin domain-containing protein [Roseovarius indicus]|uniref:Protoporphyrinogen IX dehydrogenase [menaquinone] n=1 Tax=Roseovarius indicus TaxID=540747 RepID=A0A0T5P7Y9_9RHOB|nr:flavodoxin domain-containing protein [Roseovarius indicus]KRS17189.1 protoporphyrinogen oxidase [Roseovarius indicus]QEW27566.1 Protoporphyrinogen IX dehydrogenase [menaquinone] [Roseovarius indicus]SFE35678.1 menaquinone-dependent protoporphyrinogen oxidase [Roseovarius indicus]